MTMSRVAQVLIEVLVFLKGCFIVRVGKVLAAFCMYPARLNVLALPLISLELGYHPCICASSCRLYSRPMRAGSG